jgi:O-acetyl-ADP-ribose deacetylase (regulator of RNase III)
MITFINGNVHNTTCDVIAHQVNCVGVAGAGFALAIKEKWPKTIKEYEITTKMTHRSLLGTCILSERDDNNNKYIAHIFGQEKYGIDQRMTNYEALYTGLIYLNSLMTSKNLNSVAFPDCIGCGLAGGSREIVIVMINDVFKDKLVEMWSLKNEN